MNIELLGKGNMGSVHAESYARIPGVAVQQVGRIAPSEVSSDPSVQAVDVCFPSEVHKEYVIPALNNGKHVFCETPFALNLEDADAMIAAAKQNERILMVGLLMRSIAEYQEVEKRLLSGELGKVTEAHSFRLSNYMTPGSPANRPHYGDVVSELMTFDIDYLNLLFGLPKSVSATGTNAPGTETIGEATAHIEYDDVTATVEASAIKPIDFPFTIGFDVTGEKGSLHIKTVFESEIPETTLNLVKDGVSEKLEVKPQDPYETELRFFKDCIEGKEKPDRLSAERAREALRVVIATREAINSGKSQEI